jgi:hypothetical protein
VLLQRTLANAHSKRESELEARHAAEVAALQAQYDEDLLSAVRAERNRLEGVLERERGRWQEDVCALLEEVERLKAASSGRKRGEGHGITQSGTRTTSCHKAPGEFSSSVDLTSTPEGSGLGDETPTSTNKTAAKTSRQLMF